MNKNTILMSAMFVLVLCLSVISSAYAEESVVSNNTSFVELNPENYQSEVLNSQENIVVMFYAKWCPFSTALMPIYEDIAKKYINKVKFYRFELGEAYGNFSNEETFKKWREIREVYNVTVVPTFIMYSGGKEIDRMRGRPRQSIIEEYNKYLKDWITSNLIKQEQNPYIFDNSLILRKKFQE